MCDSTINMNETYLIMAKTVEEAIAIANREYAKDGKEVTYEILEMPKKGFLGIGARDAKIKITVTESESSRIGSELSSLVADLRGMKVHTNRGGSEGEEKPKKQQNPNQKKQNAQNAPQQGQKKPAEKQAQNGQAPKQNAQKPAQPKQDAKPQKPQQPQKPAEKTAEPKKDKPQEAKKPQAPKPEGQPKSEAKPQQQKPAQKPQEKSAEPKAEPKKQNTEPKPERQPKQDRPAKQEKPAEAKKPQEPKEPKEPKQEKPVEKKPEPAETVIAEPAPAAVPVVSEETVTAEPAAEPAKTEYKSSLRNQAKPQRRQKTPKSAAAAAVPGAEAIISAPMGLTDFTREENSASFGSESSSGGRMSNDIRKKPRHPKQAIQPEQIAENIKEAREYKEVRPEIEEAVLPALDANEEITEVLSELPVSEISAAEETEETAETEASEAPAVEEDRLKVGVTEAEMQYALDFTNTLLRNMAIGATASRVECPEGEEYVIEGDANVYPKINIDGDGTGILIGHHGETLDAVQYLVNLAALRQSKQKGGDYVKIVVDIENYRAKREETLRSLARRMAARAVKYKRNVFLEPMNAYERRIIHSELHSFENVSTHSVGADKNRKIIITYEGPDKAPQQPRREKEERGEKRDTKQESRNGGSAGSGNRRNENRRPKKIQKMPIEKLPDFLASGTVEENDRFVEIED